MTTPEQPLKLSAMKIMAVISDDVLYPEATNTYILYGFDTAYISEQMLPDAEQNLLKKTKEYVKKSMIDPSTYDCEMDADFIYNNGNIRTYEVGAKVNLINKAFFPGRQTIKNNRFRVAAGYSLRSSNLYSR